MKFLCRVFAVMLSLCAVTAWADSDSIPMVQGIKSVKKNAAKNPNNPGLPNALDHISDNQRRFLEKHPGGPGSDRADGIDRTARVDKPERPEKPEKPERVDRPDRPGHGR